MSKIPIGVSMLHYLSESFQALCQQLQKVTVDHVELVDDGWHELNQKRVRKLKEVGQSKGLTYTLHAPFASINIAAPAKEMRDFIFERLERSMSFARLLDCHLMVFHPGLRTGLSTFYPGSDWKTNIMSVRRLLQLSKEYDMKIAIENVPGSFGFLASNVTEFSRLFKEIEDPLDLVLDVGHSNIAGQTREFIETFSRKIVHIHAHDNDGTHDLHLGVGKGTVNWHQFAENIKKIGFEGVVIVESYQHMNESIAKLHQLLS